jgi:hypothetical protein
MQCNKESAQPSAVSYQFGGKLGLGATQNSLIFLGMKFGRS